jgi:uncharacterized protein with FMN-binding domain
LTSIFASAGVLIVGWQMGAASAAHTTALTTLTTSKSTGSPASSATVGATATPTATASASASASPSATAAAAAPAPAAAASSDGTWQGSTIQTPFGNVQVQVTIAGGKITDVTPLQMTGPDGHSTRIDNQAVPMLLQEVLSAQSANVSSIGGATYTSDGYLQSLQAALSQAGF